MKVNLTQQSVIVHKNTSIRKGIKKRIVSCRKSQPMMSVRPVQIAEKLNGRLAMVGFTFGSSREFVEGVNYIDQAQMHWSSILILSTVLGFASMKTINLDVVENKPFTTDLEQLNGRLAMLGVLTKFVYDYSVM